MKIISVGLYFVTIDYFGCEMIIIWGLKKVVIKSQPLHSETCASCNTKGATTTHYYSRYFSIFWIPMFPISIDKETRCGKCQTKNTNPYLVVPKDKSIIHPVWTFSGLIFFVVVIIRSFI
jgi:hypothetical protein